MILVDVWIPAADDHYDFMLNENVIIEKIILEISEMIAKKMRSEKVGHFENFNLYFMDQNRMLKKEKTLYMCGVMDGSRLMLV